LLNLSSPLVRHLIPTAMIGAVSWFSSQVALSQEDASSSFESPVTASDEVGGSDVEGATTADSDMFGTEAEVATNEGTDSVGASSDEAAGGASQDAKPAKKAKAKRHRLAKKKSRKHAKKAVVAEEAPATAPEKVSEKVPEQAPEKTLTEAKNPESNAKPEVATQETTSPAAVAPVATTTPGATVADGSPLNLDNLGMSITPPKGWEVQTQNGSLSVIMREPAVANAQPGETKYQRNITIAAIHKASPIDEKRATELKAELMSKFGSDGSLSDFKVGEHKFFNFHGNNDGLLVYSTMTVREFPMMQMHILVSGKDKQFLLTYTDLASQFGAEKDPAYAAAWDSMVSIQVKGQAPTRFDLYKNHLIAGGTGLFLLLVGWILRRRAANVDFKGEADALIDSEDSLTFDASKAPKTVVSQVSAAVTPLSHAPASSTSNFSFISSF